MLLAPLLLLTIGAPIPGPCSAPLSPVFVRSIGLGTATNLDTECSRALISTRDSTSVLTGKGLAASVRAPMTVTEANVAMQILRTVEAEPEVGTLSLYSDRSMTLMDEGSIAEQATFLRELYATGAASPEQREAILAWEAQLFEEIAFVLGVPQVKLEAEMRLRHRAH